MASFDSILEGMRADGDGWSAQASPNWLQGRTLYGGLSAALALHACERAVPDLPPLRAGQVAFIGPATDAVRLVPRVLRRGKSVTFMGCDMFADGQLVLRTLYVFGGARPSQYRATAPAAPDVPAPMSIAPVPAGSMAPAFISNFEQRTAGGEVPLSGADKGDLLLWVRHKTPVRSSAASAILGLGDALPPASFTRFTGPAMISSITWNFELLDTENLDSNQWVLMRSTDDGLADGYSAQAMDMWGEDGRAILKGRQSVAIFG